MENVPSKSLYLLFFLITSPLFALSVVNVSEDDMARKAEMIVIGKVLSAYTERDPVNHNVFTYITVQVDDRLKGTNNSRNLVVRTIGGTIGNEQTIIPGAADYFKSEEVLLFLERLKDGALMPLGLAPGKYSIFRDVETGKKIVLRQSDGSGRFFSSPRNHEIRGLPFEEKVFLNDFRSRIQRIVNEGRQK